MSFERARSADAKRLREDAILRSATELALARGIRDVTLTDIAAGIGMHKSTMLRYFETREEIFLRLAATAWPEWATAAVTRLNALATNHPSAVADALASTLVERPLFCDLLAHVPLNLERGVSSGVVKDFKLTAIAAAGEVAQAIQQHTGVQPTAARNIVATATALAGALWQMAAPGTHLRHLYESDPDLTHAIIDVHPRLTDILDALITGYTALR